MSTRVAPPFSRTAGATAPAGRRSLAAVVARGARDLRRAPLTWGGGLGALSALMALVWPSIEGSVDELMKSYPPELKAAFGIERLDTVEKYIDAEMLSLIVPLAVAFFGIRCMTGAISGAEDRGRLDSLLALPLSRRVLVAGWFAVTGLATAGVLAVIWAVTWAVGALAGTGISARTLAAGVVNVWPLAMAFTGLAAAAAGALHRPGVVTALATGTLVAVYVMDVAGRVAGGLEPLRAVSAFRYYGSAIQDGVDVSHMVALTAAGVLLAAVGAVLFERRDVR